MKKYTKIWANSYGEKNKAEWKRPQNKDFGPYVVDDSKFIPMSEAVKRTARMSPLGNDVIEMIYDFPDGKAKNMNIPYARQRDGHGMAELSKFAHEKGKEIGKAKQEAVSRAIQDLEAEARIKNS